MSPILSDNIVPVIEYAQLLEVTARAIHLIVEWGDPGVAVADGLSNLLKVCHLLRSHPYSVHQKHTDV